MDGGVDLGVVVHGGVAEERWTPMIGMMGLCVKTRLSERGRGNEPYFDNDGGMILIQVTLTLNLSSPEHKLYGCSQVRNLKRYYLKRGASDVRLRCGRALVHHYGQS